MKRNIKRGVALATPFAALAVTGVAFAAWTAVGTGTGALQAQAKQAVTFATPAAAGAAQIYPGSTGDLYLQVTNPNPYKIELTTIAPGQVANITSDKPDAGSDGFTCSGSSTGLDYGWASQSVANQAIVIAPSGTAYLKLTRTGGAITMSDTPAEACSGATFQVPVSVTSVNVPASTTPTSSSISSPAAVTLN